MTFTFVSAYSVFLTTESQQQRYYDTQLGIVVTLSWRQLMIFSLNLPFLLVHGEALFIQCLLDLDLRVYGEESALFAARTSTLLSQGQTTHTTDMFTLFRL